MRKVQLRFRSLELKRRSVVRHRRILRRLVGPEPHSCSVLLRVPVENGRIDAVIDGIRTTYVQERVNMVQDDQAPKSGGLGLLATSLGTSTLSPLKPRKVLPLLSWFMDTVLLKVSSSVILMPLPLDSGSSLLTNLGGVDQVDLILRVKAHKKQRRTQDGLARIWKTMLMSRMFSLTWESTSKCR
ncbi:uncharacterized protein LOC130494514 [Raphanus sativus]|uniref:Uncharacterized protein LOC130494514 n=1 Tax=Raphanus sativus TaxID=3726 RepID=A0A9W3DAY8_RAPSA|nr:uncharacterized protein LOC130494514 [Raphanus sativus]